MDVILRKNVEGLGDRGESVKVRPGYGRNYLLPRGKAFLATAGRVRELEHKRQVVADKQRKQMGIQQGVAQQITGMVFEFEAHASEEGKLFGSVTNGDIAERLKEKGIEVDRRRIELSEPIKQVGEYTVSVRFHREVTAEVMVGVTSLAAPPPQEAPAGVGEAVGTGDEEDERGHAG